jgi:putative SOS response-associated peptidase YedK
MCGRFALVARREEIAEQFGLSEVLSVAARYNVASSQPLFCVGLSRDAKPAPLPLGTRVVPARGGF